MKKILTMILPLSILLVGCNNTTTLTNDYVEYEVPEEIEEKMSENIYDEEVIEFIAEETKYLSEHGAYYKEEITNIKSLWQRDKEKDRSRTEKINFPINGESYTIAFNITDSFYTKDLSSVEIPQDNYNKDIDFYTDEEGNLKGDYGVLVLDTHMENVSSKTIPSFREHDGCMGGAIMKKDGEVYEGLGSSYDSFQPGDKSDTMYLTMYEYKNFESNTGIDIRYLYFIPEIYIEKGDIAIIVDPIIPQQTPYSVEDCSLFYLTDIEVK